MKLSVTIEPEAVKEVMLYIPEKYRSPDRVVIVTAMNVFFYSLS